MKTLQQIREASGGKEAYQKFFNSILKKFGVSSPAELEGDQKKKFYDAIDKGWDGDNEKPEANEKMNQDNMDPETMNQADPDEEEINAAYMKAHKMNATYNKMNGDTEKGIQAGYMKSSYHVNASYHKESVNEKSKLKGGNGKAKIDINWDGSAKDKKFAETKYGIKIKATRDGAILTGDKKKILAYMTGQDYAMDDEDIEDLYPELMEAKSSPKPLSIIRSNKFSGDAVKEKMAMCEQCGKMHEEGACMEMDNDLDPETKGMKEKYKDDDEVPKGYHRMPDGSIMKDSDMKEAKNIKLSSSDMMKISKIADKNSGDMEKAIKLIDKMKKGASEHPDVMAILKLANESYGKMNAHKDKDGKNMHASKKNEGVDVDRRTKGFKAAMIRNEKSKKVREKYKKKKEAKKNQAELDARYNYDGDVDTVLAAANMVLAGKKNEDAAANAVAHGGVDMAPNAGKKKKDKEKLMARRY